MNIFQNSLPPCGEPQPGAIQSEELKLSKFSSSGKHIVTVKQIQKVMLDQKYQSKPLIIIGTYYLIVHSEILIHCHYGNIMSMS